MVQITRSQGVQVGKPREAPEVAPSIQQGQILPQAISRLGGDVATIGGIMREREAREQEAFETSQLFEVKNKLKEFDNNFLINVKDSQASPELINEAKTKYKEQRQALIGQLSLNNKTSPRLNKLIKQQAESGRIDTEFKIDNSLLQKKKQYNERVFNQSLFSIQSRFDTMTDPGEFNEIQEDLGVLLEANLSAGVINIDDVVRIEKDIKERRLELRRGFERRQAFNSILTGELLVDQRNKEDRGLLNDNYDEIYDSTDPKTAESVGMQLSIRTGIVPDKLKSAYSAKIKQGTAEQKFNTALNIDDMIKVNPSLQSEFNKDLPFVKSVVLRAEAGIPITKTIEAVEADLAKNKTTDRILREKQFEAEFGKEGNKNWINKVADIKDELEDESGFFFEAEVPEQMALSVQVLARNSYLNDGVELDTAYELAKDKIVSEWSITKIGKKRYQRYAPEKMYYQEGVDSDWINKQFKKEIKKNISDDKNLSLEIIPSTILSSKPSYTVIKENEFGGLEYVLNGNNEPITFTPDFTKSDLYKDAKQQEQKEKLRIQKAKRDVLLYRQERAKKIEDLKNRSKINPDNIPLPKYFGGHSQKEGESLLPPISLNINE